MVIFVLSISLELDLGLQEYTSVSTLFQVGLTFFYHNKFPVLLLWRNLFIK